MRHRQYEGELMVIRCWRAAVRWWYYDGTMVKYESAMLTFFLLHKRKYEKNMFVNVVHVKTWKIYYKNNIFYCNIKACLFSNLFSNMLREKSCKYAAFLRCLQRIQVNPGSNPGQRFYLFWLISYFDFWILYIYFTGYPRSLWERICAL